MRPTPHPLLLVVLVSVALMGCLTDDDALRPPEPPPGSIEQPIIIYSGGGHTAHAGAPGDDEHEAYKPPPSVKRNMQDPETSKNLCILPDAVLLDEDGYPSVAVTVINKHPVPVLVNVRVGLSTVNELYHPSADIMGVQDFNGEVEVDVPRIEPGETRVVTVTGFRPRDNKMISGKIAMLCSFEVPQYRDIDKREGRIFYTQDATLSQDSDNQSIYNLTITVR